MNRIHQKTNWIRNFVIENGFLLFVALKIASKHMQHRLDVLEINRKYASKFKMIAIEMSKNYI